MLATDADLAYSLIYEQLRLCDVKYSYQGREVMKSQFLQLFL